MQILEALTKSKLTEEDKAKIIAEGFAQVEKNYLNVDNLATKSDIKETELKLIKEIEAVRKETEDIKLETKSLEVKLISEITNITKEISKNSWKVIKWMIGIMIAIMIPIMIPLINLVITR